LDRQRSSALEIKQLIIYFAQFKANKLDPIFRDERKIHEAAPIAKRLLTVAQEADSPSTRDAKLRIEEYCQKLEQTLLKQMEAAYLLNDNFAMKQCVTTLAEFTGLQKCVVHYLEYHQFLRINFLPSKSDDFPPFSSLPLSLNHPTSPNLYSLARDTNEEDLVGMYTQIEAVCEKENAASKVIFPNPSLVISMLIQRIFKMHIQGYIIHFLSRDAREGGASLSTYLDRLVFAYEATLDLMQKLERYNTEGILDLAIWVDDIFIPYLRNEVYIEDEKVNLIKTMSSELEEFTAYKQKRKTQKQLAGVESKFSSVNVELVLNSIHEQEEAMKRAQSLSSPAHLPGNVAVLDETLLHYLGREYLTSFLEL